MASAWTPVEDEMVTRIAGRVSEQSMCAQCYLTAGTAATRRIAGTLSASIGNLSARLVLDDTTCFDFCLLSPPRTPEFVCIGLMSVMEGMTVAMALTNATVLAKEGFAQVLMKKG